MLDAVEEETATATTSLVSSDTNSRSFASVGSNFASPSPTPVSSGSSCFSKVLTTKTTSRVSRTVTGRSPTGSGGMSVSTGRTANQYSRLGASPYGSLCGVRHWLRQFLTSPSTLLGSAPLHLTSPCTARVSKLSPLISPVPHPSPRPVRGRSGRGGGGAGAIASSPLASPKPSPKQLRSKSQSKSRRYSWTAVDAENREPVASGSAAPSSRPLNKYGIVSSPKVKTHKTKTTSLKKNLTARTLMFTDDEEASSSAKIGKKVSKVRSKHGLTSNVSLTPNLNVQLSISDVPDSPKLIKKVEKVRRERSKPVGNISFKKLKTGSSQSRRTSMDTKDSGVVGGVGSSEGTSLSPRSPLSCVFSGGDQPSMPVSPPSSTVVLPNPRKLQAAVVATSSKASSGAMPASRKVLPLSAKRRPLKVSRSLSQSLVSKSLDILPSSKSGPEAGFMSSSSSCASMVVPLAVPQSPVIAALNKPDLLGCCTQSSPNLAVAKTMALSPTTTATGVIGKKILRKKLKSGNSGSASDLATLHGGRCTAGGSGFAPDSQTWLATKTSSFGTTVVGTATLKEPLVKKKKRKAPDRKSL